MRCVRWQPVRIAEDSRSGSQGRAVSCSVAMSGRIRVSNREQSGHHKSECFTAGYLKRRLRYGTGGPENIRQGQPLRKRSEEHTSELQSPDHLVCRLLLEKKKE